MLTTFYLIRHATNDLVGKAIAGRQPGVHLNPAGREEAQRLADGLAHAPIQELFCSPLDRAQETAAPLARKLKLQIHTAEEIIELQFGEWTSKRIDELAQDPRWQRWNSFRSGAQIPGGETMLQLQARFVSFLQQLRTRFPDKSIALVSHGDPIRSALLYYLGLPLDFFSRLEISPASVSVVAVNDWGAKLLLLNRVFSQEQMGLF